MWTGVSLGLFSPLLWVMALHHSFLSLPAALLLDTCLSNSHACIPALVLSWAVQEAEGQLKWNMERYSAV